MHANKSLPACITVHAINTLSMDARLACTLVYVSSTVQTSESRRADALEALVVVDAACSVLALASTMIYGVCSPEDKA